MTVPGDELHFRRADEHDVDKVLAVLNDAARWLHERQILQWPERFEPHKVLPGIAAGHTWLAERGDEPLGTLTLTWTDPLWTADGRAGYVHRLAGRRDARGLGARLLAWAGEQSLRHAREFLRLDCVTTNHRLRAYYERIGFSYRGDVEFPARDARLIRLSRYELALGPTRPI
ncbi:GNAT family N-acetyltransferase [Pseudonocardia acaciae]|uniref:GNAT family N-acetyltransferase n=1 Tax=Pseudonocardia acaciae TaxID=551276 RepID=UPI000684EDFB|nr:GNAT family N-acetyltransferase [Pseudonocardia acaciae]